jgi:pimeloyl-ACP methyl ester carboxylesterase
MVKHLQTKDYNIIAFDAPAHGNSEGNLLNVPIYNECLNVILEKHNPEILIGHSMGGMTAIFNQHQKSNSNIKKMISLGAPSDLKRIMVGLQKILALSDKFMTVTEDYFKSRYGYTFKEFSSNIFAKTINTPTLIIHDKYDKIVPYIEAVEINEALKNSELIITEGAGHSLHKSKIYKKVLEFIS